MAETRISSEIVERLHRLRLGDDEHSGVMAVLRDVAAGFPHSAESERGANLRRAVARVFKIGERLCIGSELADIVHQHHGDMVAELEAQRAKWSAAKRGGPQGTPRPRRRGDRGTASVPIRGTAEAQPETATFQEPTAQPEMLEPPEMAANSTSRGAGAAARSEIRRPSFEGQRNSEEFRGTAPDKKAPFPHTPYPEENIYPSTPRGGGGNSRPGASAQPRAAPRIPMAIGEGWRPDGKSMAEAIERLGRDDAERQLRRFVNHQLAKGLPLADHSAAFRNWVDGEVERVKRQPAARDAVDTPRRSGAKRLSAIELLRQEAANPPATGYCAA